MAATTIISGMSVPAMAAESNQTMVTSQEITDVSYIPEIGMTDEKDDTDLYLAYHNMDYSIYGKKSGNTWTLTVTLTDTYDFDAQAWKNKMSRNPAVTVINNYAAYAQSIGAIVPYDITVKVTAKVTE